MFRKWSSFQFTIVVSDNFQYDFHINFWYIGTRWHKYAQVQMSALSSPCGLWKLLGLSSADADKLGRSSPNCSGCAISRTSKIPVFKFMGDPLLLTRFIHPSILCWIWEVETRRRMAQERRETGSSAVSIETLYCKTIYYKYKSTRHYFASYPSYCFSHTEPFTHRRFCTEAVTHRSFYIQRLLHTGAFTHRRFYTQKLLHREGFTHRH